MKAIISLFIFLLHIPAYAHEFKYIKLSPKLEARLRLLEQKPNFPNAKNLRAFDAKAATLAKSGVLGGGPNETEISPIYEKIGSLLMGDYQKIGQNEAQSILDFNRQFNLGEQNFSGMTWQKPMGNFSISANRVIRRYLFTEQWIVEDTFTIYIDATTFLKASRDEGDINISDKDINLAAGLSFKRHFRYEHFANSYVEGLFSDFSKLFLSWNRFSLAPIMGLGQYEIVAKEDTISASVGGMISSPPVYGFSGAAGIMVTYNHIGKTTIQKLGPEDKGAPGEFLRVSSSKSNAVKVSATAQIQLDFLKLVQIKLLSYDFAYEYEKTQTVNLSFYDKDKEKLTGNTEESAEFKHLLGLGAPEIKALKPNIVSLDQREQQNMDSKFGFLLFGVMKKTETEQIKIVKDGSTKVFFRTHFENLKTAQNFFSRLLNTVVYAMVKFDLGTKLDSSKSRQVDIEYDYQDNGTKGEIFLDSEEKLSVTLQKRYDARDTTGFFKKGYKNHAIDLMQNYTALSADFVTMVRKDELQGPLTIHTTVRLEEHGLRYFNERPTDDIFLYTALVCGSKRPNEWRKADFRAKAMKRLQVGNELCVKNLGKDYLAYRSDLDKYHEINLKKFRDFMIGLHKQTDRMNDLKYFFGQDNIFFNGFFSAKTKAGNGFQTFFQDGTFRGLGLVDTYLRNNRTPASITSE